MDLTTGPGLPEAADSTALHRHAEALLAGLAAGEEIPAAPPGVTDTPGHWLGPAVEALTALLAGEEALAPLTKAAQLDEHRTALFLCLALAVAGHGVRVHASWLGTAFGDLHADRPVTAGQRALWLAAARGAYGPAGKIFVLRKLDAVAGAENALQLQVSDEHEAERWLKALVPGEPAVVVPPSLADFPELAEVPELGMPAQAATRLARLRGRCTEITSVRQPAKPTRSPLDGIAPWPDPAALAVLHHLIDPVGRPEPPVHTLAEHLLHDLRPGADPSLAGLALHVAAPALRHTAERLAEATRARPPEEVVVPILGHMITLRPEGPDPASLAAAEERISVESVPRRTGPWPGYALIAVGVVLLGISVISSVLLSFAGVILAVGGGYLLWRRHLHQIADAQLVATRLDELRDLANRAVWALHEYARESVKRSDAAAEDLAELTRLLRRGPRAA